MKKIKSILLTFSLLGIVMACDDDLESKGIAEGIIRFPSIEVLGDDPVVMAAGPGTYTDAGAKAFLGSDDITDQLETEQAVDLSTPGVYTIGYSVSIVNELNQPRTVSDSRFVSVTDGDVSGIDLTGDYLRNNNPAQPVVSITKLKDGVFQLSNVISVTQYAFSGLVFAIGGDKLEMPVQSGGVYGSYKAIGTITATGISLTITFVEGGNAGVTITRNFFKQ